MMRVSMITLLLAAGVVLPPGAADAQGRCRDGRTATGACVDPALADSMRQTAIIFSQPKLSSTAFPILPGLDRRYRYPNQLIPDPLKASPAFTASP